MNESDYIEVLTTWLVHHGVTVHLYHFNLHHGGRYEQETKEIFLNVPNARLALLCLAHEAGHYLGWNHYTPKAHSYQRERQAFVYGYQVLKLMGAPVSRQEWIDFHKD